jgi:hypothetical protein
MMLYCGVVMFVTRFDQVNVPVQFPNSALSARLHVCTPKVSGGNSKLQSSYIITFWNRICIRSVHIISSEDLTPLRDSLHHKSKSKKKNKHSTSRLHKKYELGLVRIRANLTRTNLARVNFAL